MQLESDISQGGRANSMRLGWGRQRGEAAVEIGVGARRTAGVFVALITCLSLGSGLALPAAAAAPSGNQYKSVTPTRVLDTRPAPNNTGTCSPSPCSTIGPGASVDVTVAGSGTPAPAAT